MSAKVDEALCEIVGFQRRSILELPVGPRSMVAAFIKSGKSTRRRNLRKEAAYDGELKYPREASNSLICENRHISTGHGYAITEHLTLCAASLRGLMRYARGMAQLQRKGFEKVQPL